MLAEAAPELREHDGAGGRVQTPYHDGQGLRSRIHRHPRQLVSVRRRTALRTQR